MKPDHSFERQLDNLRHESVVVATYVYAEMALQHAGSKSKKLLSRLNMTPTFWNACHAAFQSAAYVALGRVFDLKSPYNIEALLVSLEKELQLFQRPALESRKRAGFGGNTSWLKGYLDSAYYPDVKDITRLRSKVSVYREIYERAVMPVRHQYLAHRQAHDESKVQELYGRGKVKEMWRLSSFLVKLHLALRELHLNGRKPVLRPARFSVKSMYDVESHRTGPHEYIVQDVRKLMKFMESATVARTA
jgi:HEPN superfamily AbiU2-like protein